MKQSLRNTYGTSIIRRLGKWLLEQSTRKLEHTAATTNICLGARLHLELELGIYYVDEIVQQVKRSSDPW